MKVRITMEVDVFVETDIHQIQGILNDALYEFRVCRSPEEDYVNRRYDYMVPAKKKEKVVKVNLRNQIAAAMHRGSFHIGVEKLQLKGRR